MQLTEEGLALIREFEGFRSSAYRCPAGVLTIGYGHTGRAGPPAVKEGMTMTEPEARIILVREANAFAEKAADLIRHPLSDAQFSALVSFAFNVGIAAFASSSVLKAVNGGDLAAVPRRLQLWVKAGGRVLPGLVRRRAAEAALFAGAREQESRTAPQPPKGTPPHKSSTVIAALIALFSALLPGVFGAEGQESGWALPLAAAGTAAALWVIRERLRHAREEGL